jgi:hypothetical protein
LTLDFFMSTPSPGTPPDAIDDDDDGDRVSVTDVHGTVARFDMSYPAPSPGKRAKFGPPLRTRIPSAIYLVAAIAFGAVTWYAYSSPSNSTLFVWAVEGDRIRPLSLGVVAIVLLVSAAATVLRTHMRGVIVSDDWIEARSLLFLGIPRARRWGWAQVTRMVVDDTRVAIQMYDGAFERLPKVAHGAAFVRSMMHHAARLRIQVTVLERVDRPDGVKHPDDAATRR